MEGDPSGGDCEEKRAAAVLAEEEAAMAETRGVEEKRHAAVETARQTEQNTMKTGFSIPAIAVLFTVLITIPRSAIASEAEQVLAASGVHGGLVVHLGCGDGKLTAALGTGNEFLIVGLDTNADRVATARESIQAAGLYGRVSADKSLWGLPGTANWMRSPNWDSAGTTMKKLSDELIASTPFSRPPRGTDPMILSVAI